MSSKSSTKHKIQKTSRKDLAEKRNNLSKVVYAVNLPKKSNQRTEQVEQSEQKSCRKWAIGSKVGEVLNNQPLIGRNVDLSKATHGEFLQHAKIKPELIKRFVMQLR